MKVISLISGGIDSPVAAALALQGGAEVVCVHFQNHPSAERREEEKVKEILKNLSKRFNKKIKLYIIPYQSIQKEIAEKIEKKLFCILCKRMMFKVASAISAKEKAVALVTGESLGQVASQTLSNLGTLQAASRFPVLRPLLGMDKLEIEALAKQFGTFNTSILPAKGCTLVPEKPATKSTAEKIAEEEGKLNEKGLVERALKEKSILFFGN